MPSYTGYSEPRDRYPQGVPVGPAAAPAAAAPAAPVAEPEPDLEVFIDQSPERMQEIREIFARAGLEYIENPTPEQKKAKKSEYRQLLKTMHPDRTNITEEEQEFLKAFTNAVGEKYGSGRKRTKLVGSGIYKTALGDVLRIVVARFPAGTVPQEFVDEAYNDGIRLLTAAPKVKGLFYNTAAEAEKIRILREIENTLDQRIRSNMPAGAGLKGSGKYTDQLIFLRNAALANVPNPTQRQREETQNMLNRAKARLNKTSSTYPLLHERSLVRRVEMDDPIASIVLGRRAKKEAVVNKFANELQQYFNPPKIVTFPRDPELTTAISFDELATGTVMTDINNERTERGNLYTKQEIDSLKKQNEINNRPFTSPFTTLPVRGETNYIAHIKGEELPEIPAGLGPKTGPKRSLIGKFQHWLKGSPKPVYEEDEYKEFMQSNPLFNPRIIAEEDDDVPSAPAPRANAIVYPPGAAGVGLGKKRGKGASDDAKFQVIVMLIKRSNVVIAKINEVGLTKQLFDELDPLLTNLKREIEKFLVRPRASRENKTYLRDYLHNVLSMIATQMSNANFSTEAVGFGKMRGGSWESVLTDIASAGFEVFRDYLIKNPEILIAAFGTVVLTLKQFREIYRYFRPDAGGRRSKAKKCNKCKKLKGGSDEASDDEVARLLGAMEEETGLEESRPRGPAPPKRPTRIERPPIFEDLPIRMMPKPARRQGTKRSHARMVSGFGRRGGVKLEDVKTILRRAIRYIYSKGRNHAYYSAIFAGGLAGQTLTPGNALTTYFPRIFPEWFVRLLFFFSYAVNTKVILDLVLRPLNLRDANSADADPRNFEEPDEPSWLQSVLGRRQEDPHED